MMRSVLLGQWVLWLVSLAGCIAPIWLTKTLPTTDGPSHVYNAILSDAIRRGDDVIASRLTCKSGIRNNMATETLLALSGPYLGWEMAERCLATLIVFLTFFSMRAWIASRSGRLPPIVAPYAGWLASSWFFWMGFYDFQLSLAFFAMMLAWLSRPRAAVLDAVALPILFGALYVAHLYTFVAAAGIGLVLVLGRVDRAPLNGLRATMFSALFAVGLSCILSNRATSFKPTDLVVLPQLARNAIGVVVSDSLIGGTCLGIAAGLSVTVLFAAAAFAHWRVDRLKQPDSIRLSVVEFVALALIFGSILLPDEIGQGSYVSLRTRALGMILLLPFALTVVSIAWPGLSRLMAHLLVVLLLGNAVIITQASASVASELRVIETALDELDLPAGTLVQAQLAHEPRTCLRIRADIHLAERAFGDRRLIAIDNYEAFLATFANDWKSRPDGLEIDPAGRVSLVPRDWHWSEPAYILHASEIELKTDDNRLHIAPAARRGRIAIDAVTVQANRK